MENSEKIVGAVVVRDFNTYAFIVTATAKGMIKKTLISRFEVQRANKVMTAMKLKKDDEVIAARLAYPEDDVLLASKDGYYNFYSCAVLSDIAPKALGVGGISVKNDEVSDLLINHHDGKELLVAAQRGLKRLHFADLQYTNRNVKGYRLFKQLKTNPYQLRYLKSVLSHNDLLIDQQRLNVSSVPFMSCEQSFSAPIELSEGYSLILDDMSAIEEAAVIALPADYLLKQETVDQFSIFQQEDDDEKM